MPTAESVLALLTDEWQSTGSLARQLLDRSLPHRVRKAQRDELLKQLREAADRGDAEWRYELAEGGEGGRREWRLPGEPEIA